MTKYILIENDVYDDNATVIHECEDFDALVAVWRRTTEVINIYEITRSIPDSQMRLEVASRDRIKMEKREAAMIAARAVLSPDQLKDLGL